MPAPGYLRFAFADPANARFLAFGFAMTFASSVGQTYFIGAFGPALRGEFGLSHTGWSAIYMAGTLVSALVLPWTGKLIDSMSLRTYTAIVSAALVLAAAFMAVVPTAGLLILAIFLLRQTGQGLASHIGTTATARHYVADRGKAVALVSLGYSVGEAMLPFLAVLSIAAIGWRSTYGAVALMLTLGLAAATRWLLQDDGCRDARLAGGEGWKGEGRRPSARPPEAVAEQPSWTRREVLRHGRFYLMLPAAMAPSFIITALFFHNLEIAEVKGWGAGWLTGSYWVFAVGAVAASLAVGPAIDRLTAARVLPLFLMPMVLGLLVIWGFDGRLWAWPYLLFLGVTNGMAYTALTALWAEVYGVGHLGAIRSMVASILVFSSALGPLAMGALMDAGVSVERICAVFALYCVVGTVLMLAALNGYRRRPSPSRASLS